MATLNKAEQEGVDRAEALEAALQRGERVYIKPNGDQVFVSEAVVKEARQIADWQVKNAEARERREAEQAAEQAAKQAKRQAEIDAQVAQAESAYLRQARRAYSSDADFERDKAQLLYDYRREQIQGADAVARNRVSSVYDGF